MENLQLDINHIAMFKGILPAHSHLINIEEWDNTKVSEDSHPEMPEKIVPEWGM